MHNSSRESVMSGRRVCPVFVEMEPDPLAAGINAPVNAEPAEISLSLRERGWIPCRIRFDAQAGAWIASVIYRPSAH
jgi:hypothetical protein